jgi:hypothetical protein
MEWYTIPEISFQDYVRCLEQIYLVLEEKLKKSKSSPDVFMKTILIARGGITAEQWEITERLRLYEKVLSMKLGDFHEELMGKFPGFRTFELGHPTGTDVGNFTVTVVIEVKNKDNTMNHDSAKSVIAKLTKLADSGTTAILAMINSNKKRLPRFGAPKNVTVMNGRQIYAYLSGRESFIDDLLLTLEETFRRFMTFEELQKAAAGIIV